MSWKPLGTECSESFSLFSEESELPREAEPHAGVCLSRGLCCNWADMICTSLLLSSCTVIMNNSLNGFIIFKCQRGQTLLRVYVTVLITNSKIPLAQNCNAEYKLDYYIFWGKYEWCLPAQNALPQYSGLYIHLIFNTWTDTTMFELELCQGFGCLVILDVQKQSIMLIDVTNWFYFIFVIILIIYLIILFYYRQKPHMSIPL